MILLQMKAKGFRGLEIVDVELKPGGGVIEVHGKNGAGKSSFLDIIACTVGGTSMRKHIVDARTDGEKKAKIEVITDDGYTIVREWKKNGSSTLEVFHEDDGMITQPAAWLKDAVGEISLDPMMFAKMQPRDQKKALMQLVGLEDKMAELDAKKKGFLADKKTAKDALTVEEEVVARAPQVDKSLLIEGKPLAINVSALQAEIDDVEGDRQACNRNIESLDRELIEGEKALSDLVEEKKRLEDKMGVVSARLVDLKEESNQYPDTESQRQEVEKARAHNEQIDIAIKHEGSAERIEKLEEEVTKVADQLEDIETQRVNALESAKFPIDGLGFDEEGVTFKGRPFTEIEESQRLRIGIRMVIASDPQCKVIRVTDASLLDDDSIAEMDELAKKEGYQFWLEIVGGGEGKGILIEERTVVSVDGKKA